MSNHEISFNTNLSEPARTRADFTYKITPSVISIVDTGLGQCPVTDDIEAVLRKIEYWHQGAVTALKIMYRDEHGVWNGVRWDGQRASSFTLGETDEKKGVFCELSRQTAGPSKTPLEAFAVHCTPLWAPEGFGYCNRVQASGLLSNGKGGFLFCLRLGKHRPTPSFFFFSSRQALVP